jgi:hypothetical protein
MPNTSDYSPKLCVDTVAVIAQSGTASAAVDLMGTTLAGLFTPAALTGTAMTFSTSPTADGTYTVIEAGAGSSYSVTVSASKFIAVDTAKFLGVRFLKVISGSAEAASRSITLATRPM